MIKFVIYIFCRFSLDQLNAANENLKVENDNLNKKCGDLESRLSDHYQEYEQLKLKHQQAVNEHAETVRGLKVSF